MLIHKCQEAFERVVHRQNERIVVALQEVLFVESAPQVKSITPRHVRTNVSDSSDITDFVRP
jgi:hypothetical protein